MTINKIKVIKAAPRTTLKIKSKWQFLTCYGEMGRLSSMAPEKSVLNLPSVSSNCPEESYSSCQWYHVGRRGQSEQRISSVPHIPASKLL